MESAQHEHPVLQGLRSLVAAQGEAIDQLLRPALQSHARVALVNFPNHHNVGDPAIWLGTRSVLERLGVRVTYQCDWRTYERDSLARALASGTDAILLCGGGNLGDVYPAQKTRESVLRDFREAPVVQLAQSAWFRAEDNAQSFGRLARSHASFTLFVRDQLTLERMEQLGLEPRLCPDMAMGLGLMERRAGPETDVLWLRRTDEESLDRPSAQAAVKAGEAVDWLTASSRQVVQDRWGRRLQSLNRTYGGESAEGLGVLGRGIRRRLPLTYRALAKRRLDYGLRLLSRGRVVVSDRLHGHLLAILLGIPSVAVDNGNGKVRSYVDTWFGDTHDGVRLATSPDEADTKAQQLLRSLSS